MRTAIITKTKKQKDDTGSAIVLGLPSLIFLTVFIVLPLAYSLVMSFADTPKLNVVEWVGFKNYIKVLSDSVFWKAMWVGIRFVLVVVPIQIVIAFFLASLITKLSGRLSAVFKTALYIPCVLSGIVIGVIFLYLFNHETGVLNAVITTLWQPFVAMGAKPYDPIAWLSEPSTAWVACSFAMIWSGVGYTTLIILGGLYDIPKDYYEAATIDGAGKIAKLLHITLPGLKNVVVFVLISLVVSTFQVFEIPFMMTGKGPLNSTMGPIGLLFEKFNYDTISKSYATTSSIIIGAVLASIASIIFRVISSEKSEA